MDDIFVLFELPELAHPFQQYMLSKHKAINIALSMMSFALFCFEMLKLVLAINNLSPGLIERQHLAERTKRASQENYILAYNDEEFIN